MECNLEGYKKQAPQISEELPGAPHGRSSDIVIVLVHQYTRELTLYFLCYYYDIFLVFYCSVLCFCLCVPAHHDHMTVITLNM